MSLTCNKVKDGESYDVSASKIESPLPTALKFNLPFDPTLYDASAIKDMKYNGREIIAVGYKSPGGGFNPLVFRCRDGLWTDISTLIPNPTDKILYGVDWDGEKWWICAEDYNNASCPLYTLDMNNMVVDLTGNINNMTKMRAIKCGGGRVLVGGWSPISIPRLWKIEGDAYTEITGSLQGAVNLDQIRSLDYYNGLWMIGGMLKLGFGNQGWLNSWDGTTFTDLSSNLPNDAQYRGKVDYIEHNASYWVFGLGTESTLVTYDGSAWTIYIYPQLPAPSAATSIKPVWTGHEWLLIYDYVVEWDGSKFTNITSLFPKPDYIHHGTPTGIGDAKNGVFSEGKVLVIPSTQSASDPGLYSRVYYGIRLGPTISTSLVDRRNQTSQFIDALSANNVISDTVKAKKEFDAPIHGVGGAPPWSGKNGSIVVNIADNKLYWWANGAWRST
jgi:hypothetical protein